MDIMVKEKQGYFSHSNPNMGDYCLPESCRWRDTNFKDDTQPVYQTHRGTALKMSMVEQQNSNH